MTSEIEYPAGPVADKLTRLDGSWSLRLGPLTVHEVGKAITAFVR